MATTGRVDFVIGVVGALLLAHGAFSTIQYRGALKIREEDFTYPPAQDIYYGTIFDWQLLNLLIAVRSRESQIGDLDDLDTSAGTWLKS